MDLIVFWSRLAEEKLEDIFNYYKEKAGISIARKIITGIIDRTEDLEHNPEVGAREELLIDRVQDFRYLIYTNYKIIYWLNQSKGRMEIANVFDTRQHPSKIQEIK